MCTSLPLLDQTVNLVLPQFGEPVTIGDGRSWGRRFVGGQPESSEGHSQYLRATPSKGGLSEAYRACLMDEPVVTS